MPESDSRIGNVIPRGPADRVGIRRGDRIISIGDQPIERWSELRSAMERHGGGELIVSWERDGERHQASLLPDEVEETLADGTKTTVAKLQVMPYSELYRLGPVDAFSAGIRQTGLVIGDVFVFLKYLFAGRVGKDDVGGPIQIFQFSGQQAKQGFDRLLALMAFLSVQLGILNLLPIPVLDGGHMVFLIAEAIRRRPLSIGQRQVLQHIGLLVILGLMLTVTVFDVGRLFR